MLLARSSCLPGYLPDQTTKRLLWELRKLDTICGSKELIRGLRFLAAQSPRSPEPTIFFPLSFRLLRVTSRLSSASKVEHRCRARKKTTDLDLVLRSRSRAQVPNSPQPAAISNPQPAAISQPDGSAIRAALEETGAAWIKNLSNPRR